MPTEPMKKYNIRAFWSTEDSEYVAVCPDFPALSGVGITEEEARTELWIALSSAIEIYQEEGWVLPCDDQGQRS